MKAFVRKRIDETFARMITLIDESFVNFINVNLSLKLFRRFWRTLEAYDKGDTYEQVLKLFSVIYLKNKLHHIDESRTQI